MKTLKSITLASLVCASLLSLGACSGMSARDRNTAVGAGVGAVGGAVLTGGSGLGTVGGAAVGGFIGNQVDTNDSQHQRKW
ncbi:glycine zipper 2TM domain-containing protein [Comamonas testosteroni]|uniref:glycine zipper 2TM domain-containing protein n=1 Tax=Comamonas TaxID=283 RepID=UPI0000E76F59|nr:MULTISPECIES: glycine zipper 2TM domain-containing protein [Comamonas]TYK73597.1 glycine zipper 2TM domain-containing protein [Comamonas sp. Z3]WQG66364.1 glycine zipper 2TM domain-containing protein [Comamonas testosteroni]